MPLASLSRPAPGTSSFLLRRRSRPHAGPLRSRNGDVRSAGAIVAAPALGAGGRRWAAGPSTGFTALELLLAVLLLGLLAAAALPVYSEHVARARRANMQAVLLEDADYMQRYYASNAAFDGDPPPELSWTSAPHSGEAPAYRISLAVPAGDPTRFILTATRDGTMRGDRCGDFTYDQLGQRGLVAGSAAPGATIQGCWR
jgi:type IV pilus assembly protein PilE